MHYGQFLFFAVVAGGTAFWAAFNQQVPFHIFATVAVAVYAVALGLQARKAARLARQDGKAVELSTQHPESVYIVGYIATIGGFAGLAVFLGKDAARITDFKGTLPMILERGGFAVISTLVGLVAMNVLKMQADTQSHPGSEQDEFINKFSEKFATEFTKTLGNTEQTTALAQVMAQATTIAPIMNQLGTRAQEVQEVMQAAAKQMPQLEEGLARFQALSDKVLPAWDKVTGQVEEAARLNAALAKSADAMQGVQISSTASAKAVGAFAEALPVLQKQFTEMLGQVRLRLDALNQFGDELTRFLDYARQASPILTALREGFGDLVGIGENLKLVSGSLLRVNEQLLTFQRGAIDLTQTSGDFGRNIGTLSIQISTAMNELARLTVPLQRIGEMAETAASASTWFEGHADGLQAFKDNLTGLVAASEALKGAAGNTAEAVTSSAKTLKELQVLMPQFASARVAQLEKL